MASRRNYVLLYFFVRCMTTMSTVIFLVSTSVHLAAIKIIWLDNDGWMASADAMATCAMVIVLLMLGLLRIVMGKKGGHVMAGRTT